MAILKQATLQDIVPLAALFDAYRVFYKKESNLPQAINFLTERIKNSQSVIYVAEYNENTLAGFVQLYPVFSSTQMKKLWLLNDLYVSPEFRGKHISLQLIDKAKQLAMETSSCGLMLETAKTNTIGNTLYPASGFHLHAESNYYHWNI